MKILKPFLSALLMFSSTITAMDNQLEHTRVKREAEIDAPATRPRSEEFAKPLIKTEFEFKKTKLEPTEAASAGEGMAGVAPVQVAAEVKLTAQQRVHAMDDTFALVLNDLDVAEIKSIGDLVCQMQGVTFLLKTAQVLRLCDNNLRRLPRGFEELTSLRKLSLSNNQLTEFLPDRCLLTGLEELDISNNLLGKARICWSGFFRLKKLVARNAQLVKLDDTIANLASLTDVDFSHNGFRSISPMLLIRNTLVRLDFSHNKITTLSAEICNLNHLAELRLDGNRLTALPREIVNLPALCVLSLIGNRLQTVPHDFERLTNLRILALSGNKLTYFPQQICKLGHLEELYLDSNELCTFDEGVSEAPFHLLKALRVLSVNHNLIVSLPHAIVFLQELRRLHLSHNKLLRLPWEIAKLSHLEELDADNNQLTELPAFLFDMPCLVRLSVGNNPVPDLEKKARDLQQKITVVCL